ncbi:MAG: protein-glutamate O-methyltransferase CheR [Polyangiaceae bacterium]|nr:protein-glutamate O-methyltransferase CheR [Polyangiaceae bacterium]
MSTMPLTPQLYAIFNALIEERLGIHYGPRDMDLFGSKVTVRAADAGFDSLLDYYYFLRYDPAGAEEFDALVDALVVGETYFFRELEPLVVIIRDLVTRIRNGQTEHRPRIWSAACSTGEEPYTVAILLAEHDMLDKVDIVASDISARAIQRAKAGEFGSRALREHAPIPDFARPWITRDGDRVIVSDRIRSAVDFRRINLVDDDAIRSLGTFDLILCRNVLIYFQDATARRVVDNLGRALRRGGTLLVGIAESLYRLGTSLTCEERGGVFVYRQVA